MQSERGARQRAGVGVFVRSATLALCLAAAGCASVDRSVALVELAVVPFTAGEAGSVSPDEMTEAMLRAGFTPEQVLDHGPAIASALASSGAAQVRSGDVIEALFAIFSSNLYVTSRTRGAFMQPLGAPML